MTLFTWLNRKSAGLRWYDIGIIKVAVAAFILLVAKLWPPLLSLDWTWYAAIFAVVYAVSICRTFLTPDP